MFVTYLENYIEQVGVSNNWDKNQFKDSVFKIWKL